MSVAWWVTCAVVGIVLLAVGGAELAQWVASRRYFPPKPTESQANAEAEVVVVLGCPTARDGQVSSTQRWRTEIGVRSGRLAEDDRLVFTGAATLGAAVAEAATMAGYARSVLGVPAELIVVEPRARSTQENLAFSAPFLEQAAQIKIASNPLHAARARYYLRDTRPDLFARLVRADDYRPFEHLWLKLSSAIYELGRPVLRRGFPSLRNRFQGRTRPKP